MPAISTRRLAKSATKRTALARQGRPGPHFNGEKIRRGEDLPSAQCARWRSTGPTREIAVDWRLTNSDELGDTQLKNRCPEVLTPQHSANLGATQHNSAKLGQFRLLIWRLRARLPPRSPLIPKDLATSTSRLREIIGCWSLARLSHGSPLIRQHLRRSRHHSSRVWCLDDVRKRVVKTFVCRAIPSGHEVPVEY
jgi:hypothetical protein